MSIKILTLNARGLRDTLKRRKIFNYYRNKADLMWLQESHSTKNDELIWESEWNGDIMFSHGQSNARGVCVLMPKGTKTGITNVRKDCAGRLIKFELTWQNGIFSVINLYAPNKDTPSYFEDVSRVLNDSNGYLILIGDFNLVMNVNNDRLGSKMNNVKSLNVILDICEEFVLCEIWRTKNENERCFSWYRTKPNLQASRIDFALISQELNDLCENCGYINGLQTDHLAFFVYLNITENERGRGYWKLNTTYLINNEYINVMNHTFEEIERTCQHKNIKDKWEYAKFRLKEESMEFSRNKASEIELIIAQLSENICDMEAKLENANLNLLEKTKTDLEEFMEHKVKACIFRSKVRYYEHGEKPTKYYFNLEKSKYKAKTCNALYDDSNNLVSDTQGILKLQERYYQSLYSENTQVHFSMENTYGIKVSKEYREKNQLGFTMDELAIAVKQLPNGKTCGYDGLPIEFYKIFWNKIKHMMYNLINEVYKSGLLHNTALLGVMNLIPKANKDTRFFEIFTSYYSS